MEKMINQEWALVLETEIPTESITSLTKTSSITIQITTLIYRKKTKIVRWASKNKIMLSVQ